MIVNVRKMFSLLDMKHVWLLLLTSVLFGLSNYMDRMYTNDPIWLHICYWISFAIAVLWGALNYISHIRMNVIYQKQNDIQAYVEKLALNKEDKLELQHYLEDYTEDLMKHGKTKEEASKEAINQFKVKEILTMSKNTMLFDLHAHYYLIGWTFITVIAFIFTWALELIFSFYPFITLTIESVFIAYGIGLFGMFFVYKLLDAFIQRKFNNLLT